LKKGARFGSRDCDDGSVVEVGDGHVIELIPQGAVAKTERPSYSF
jgi:hypothetical protein